MTNYRIDFSKYKLRQYEKELAVREFEHQFPNIEKKSVTDEAITFVSPVILDECKLKKLTFYSEFHCKNGEYTKQYIPTDQTLIENFQKYQPNLFNGIRPNTSREIRYLTHSLHEYKGRFYPQLAKSLFNYAGLKQGDTVLDPFCGSGTTLLESLLFGINATGIDINPVAFMIARAKIQSVLLNVEELSMIDDRLKEIKDKSGLNDVDTEQLHHSLDIDYLKKWFPIINLNNIISIQSSISNLPKNLQFLPKVVLSNLLRKFSYQDPNQLRIRRRSDTPPENLIPIFQLELQRQIENLLKFKSIKKFDLQANVRNYLGDIRTLMQNDFIDENSVDAVITSPPYATALPYVDTDRLSLFAFGYTDKEKFKQLEKSLIGNREINKSERVLVDGELEKNFESPQLPVPVIDLLKKIYHLNKNADVGFRRKNKAALLYKYFMDMQEGIQQVSKALKKGKFAFFVVGNNQTKAGEEHIDIPTDDFIGLIAEHNNFKLVEKISMSVQKGYMIHAKNAIHSESILVLQNQII